MKKYFLIQNQTVSINASPELIELYREKIIQEMKKLGATSQEIELLQYETILNSINNKRKPEDVAWAILQ